MSRSLRASASSPSLDLAYENRVLREQLQAAYEDLRLARDQLARERSRSDRMAGIYQERIATLESDIAPGSAGPSSFQS